MIDCYYVLRVGAKRKRGVYFARFDPHEFGRCHFSTWQGDASKYQSKDEAAEVVSLLTKAARVVRVRRKVT